MTDDNSNAWTVLVDEFNPKENGNIYRLDNPTDMAKIRIVPLTAASDAEQVIFTADVFICEGGRSHLKV